MSYDYTSELAPNTYYDRHFHSEAVKILPGEYYVTQRDLLIVTVLGCSITGRSPTRGATGVGGVMGATSSAASGRSARWAAAGRGTTCAGGRYRHHPAPRCPHGQGAFPV